MGPVLLELAGVDDWGVFVAPEALPELVADCFAVGVGVVDCELVVVVLIVELEVVVTVADVDTAWVCEIVFAASAGSECQVIPAGLSIPAPSGSGAISA
jgi:hypothetical protein